MKELDAKLTAIQKQLSEIQETQQMDRYLFGDLVPGSNSGNKKSSNVFWGINAGVFYDSGSSVDNSGNIAITPASFSFTVKPRLGIYLSDRFIIGVMGEFAYNGNEDHSGTFIGNIASGFEQVSFRNVISNVVMGNGVGMNFLSWKVLPYARYKVTDIFSNRINLWVELELYAGQKYKMDSTTNKYGTPATIYGAALSPVISYDLSENMMLCFIPDFIRWDGTKNLSGNDVERTGSFSAQLNPLYQVISGIIHVSLIKKF